MDNIEKPEFKLIGLKLHKKTSNKDGQSTIECGNLWQKFEKENFSMQIPYKTGDQIYAVYL
jgi:predicted transcriptional regulator YdeE